MKKTLILLSLIGIFSLLIAEDVTFNVDMSYQTTLGNFNPETDFVDVAGNFNNWTGSGPMNSGAEGFYTITIPDLDVGFICEYKFRINGNWDTSEFPGGANRTYEVIAGENIVNAWYNDQEPPVGDPALITFTIDDSGDQSYTGFFLKGSWDVNGTYDTTWGNGAEHSPFYDDGTNGDVTANDHIWTAQQELFPDNGAHTWEWGINDDMHNWITGNFQFTIVDETPQSLSYTIPTGITQDVTVTFQVDMSLIQNVNDVFVGGDFNDWDPTSIQMSDDDLDFIYTAEVLFPVGSDRIHTYKYLNGSDWELLDNRSFEIDDSAPTQTLDVVFFNDMSVDDFTNQDVTVTFQVDMQYVSEVGEVTLSGDFNSWNIEDLILSDDDNDQIYTIDVLFTSGSYKFQGYKFLNNGTYENLDNRMLEIDDTNATQILDVVYFNDSTSSNDEQISDVDAITLYNYPNPFNPQTTISYNLKENALVSLNIYNIKGQKVKTLINEEIAAGNHKIVWNGKNDSDQNTGSGIYFARFTTSNAEGKYTSTKKMILMK